MVLTRKQLQQQALERAAQQRAEFQERMQRRFGELHTAWKRQVTEGRPPQPTPPTVSEADERNDIVVSSPGQVRPRVASRVVRLPPPRPVWPTAPPPTVFSIAQTHAFNNYVRQRIEHREFTFRDFPTYLDGLSDLLRGSVAQYLQQFGALKVTIQTMARFHQLTDTTQTIEFPLYTREAVVIRNMGEFEALRSQLRNTMQHNIDTVVQRGSNWVLDALLFTELKLMRFQPTKGTRGGTYIPTPKFYEKLCINVRTDDDYCFLWAVAAGLCQLSRKIPELAELWPTPNNNLSRASHYRHLIGRFNIEGLTFPLSVEEVDQFLAQNRHIIPECIGMSIMKIKTLHYGGLAPTEDAETPANFVRERKVEDLPEEAADAIKPQKEFLLPVPVFTSQGWKRCTHFLDLMLIQDEVAPISHYAYLRNYDALFQSKHQHRVWVCRHCNVRFRSEDKYREHVRVDSCDEHVPARLVLPKAGQESVKLKAYQKKMVMPFVIYADGESYLRHIEAEKPVDEADQTTRKTKRHELSGLYMRFVSRYPNILPSYSQMFATAEEFVAHLQEKIPLFLNRLRKTNVPMKSDRLSVQAREDAMDQATHCHICEQRFKPGDERVQDHDHLSGEFRGAAHARCNLDYNFKDAYIPVYFHNFRGYDHHFLIRPLARTGLEISRPLADNLERYRSFMWNGYRFLDSMQMTGPVSLDTLVSNLASKFRSTGDPKLFANLMSVFPEPQHYELLMRKGVFPYDFWDGPEKADYPLPVPREHFYDSLNHHHISDEDYVHHLRVVEAFGLTTLKQYHDLYLQSDVLLLADVFEDMRNTFLASHKIDPCWEYSAPGLSWDAALRQATAPITCFKEGEEDMLLMIERGMRGGNCFIAHRYAKANNPYLPNHDPSQPNTYLLGLDANNLYPFAMSQKLPTGKYTWVDPALFPPQQILSIPTEGETGYAFEVDGYWPPETHDVLRDYPIFSANRQGQWSPYMQALMGDKVPPNEVKLIAGLDPVDHYVCHYRMLQLALRMGFVLTKVHRVLSFHQDHIFRDYVALNTRLRQQTRFKSEQDLYKLLNNSLYGKTNENVRKYRNVEFITTEERAQKLMNRNTLKEMRDFNDLKGDPANFIDFLAAEFHKRRIVYKKPIILGFTVLELSKVHMLEFHYGTMKTIYPGPEQLRLLFTDTDSLYYSVRTEDVFVDLKRIQDQLDCSEYPTSGATSGRSPPGLRELCSLEGRRPSLRELRSLYDVTNKKVMGKFKDESAAGNAYKMITEFVGLRPKMYSILTHDLVSGKDGGKQAAKGVKKAEVERSIRHQNYLDCLFGRDVRQTVNFNLIRADKHEVYTINVTKTGLSATDDKRHVLDDGISTVPHGHYLTRVSPGGARPPVAPRLRIVEA